MARPLRLARLTALLLTLPLTSCMVGPNFSSPKQNLPEGYTAKPLPKTTASKSGPGGSAQSFQMGRNLPAQWWNLFHSPQLNKLINHGLVNSPNLAAAMEALQAARANLAQIVGNNYYPAVDLPLSGMRESMPSSTMGDVFPNTIFNVYNIAASVSYNLDVFGGLRRQVEAANAQVDYQSYQLGAAYLTLTSNITTTTIATASYRAQMQTLKDLIRAQAEQLQIMHAQFKDGGISYENVLSQKTLLEQTKAKLPPMQQNLSKAEHALTTLVGEFPNHVLPKINLEDLNLPKDLPVSLASDLVKHRPDVQAAESLVHVASANIGVATANLLPKFSISAGYGWNDSSLGGIFDPANVAWSYGSQIAQPIFHGGALWAARKQAIASYQQALQQYKQTLLQAFQNVADSLTAIEHDAKLYQATRRGELAAEKNWRLNKAQYADGGVSYLTLLTAQQQYQQAVIARVQAQAMRYADTAALFQALGGDWWQHNFNAQGAKPCQQQPQK